jgi:tRNA dimethylallyltransferase
MQKKLSSAKLIVILGPTASGKSDLAVKIAKKFNAEIISADSRQIYKGMDIGTGKITKKEMRGIPHYLLDVASPKKRFSVIEYRKLAIKAINKIFRKRKIPILCGGTGFYIQAVVDGIIIPEVRPDWKLRKKLEKKSVEELYQILKKLDPQRAETIDNKNKRRLIRALEIIIKTKKAVPQLKKNPLPYPILIIGIKKSKQELKKIIKKRVEKMFKIGLEKEVKNLVKKHGWIPPFQTIGYQEWKDFFERKINKEEVKQLITQRTAQFAKRQITWFKKYAPKTCWIKNYQESEKLITEFLRSKNEGKNEGKLQRR